MVIVGKRPTHVVTTRCTLRCPHPFPKMVRNKAHPQFKCACLLLFYLSNCFTPCILLKEKSKRKEILCRQKSLFERLEVPSKSSFPHNYSSWLPTKTTRPKKKGINMRGFVSQSWKNCRRPSLQERNGPISPEAR